MSVLEIIELAVIGIGILAVGIYTIVMAIKNKWLSQLADTLKTAVKEAEELFLDSGSGELKKAYVLEKIQAKCDELGIPYKLLQKLISMAIDTIIDNYNTLTKGITTDTTEDGD